jgi:hypothetical protein
MTIRTKTLTLTTLVFLVCVAGCSDHGHTDQIIAAGKSASAALQTYYTHLTKTTTDWWEYQTSYNTIQEIATTQELEQIMTARVAALRSRATMAARLADLYDTISRLRDPQSSQPAITAAQNLGKAMSGLPKLPGGGAGTELEPAATFLAGLQRERDFKEANKALRDAIKRVLNLYVQEQETYRSIQHDRDSTRHALLQSLSRKKLINTAPLLDQLGLGINWTTNDPDTTRALALSIDETNTRRIESSWLCATEETATMLTMLADAHEQLATNSKPTPLALQRAINRASACLDDGGKQ